VRGELFTLLAFFVVVPLLAFAQQAPPARPFQRFDGCIYKPQRWNDGDSFHAILPDEKELIFRLYFVDTPEWVLDSQLARHRQLFDPIINLCQSLGLTTFPMP
jgi:hypothetical protein